MIIKTLVENISNSSNLGSEHGLSLYIETKEHRLLFDMGASALFTENAKKMDVDLAEVDLAMISHGHYDHGGGLKAFLSTNNKAKVYLNKKAFEKHYSSNFNGEKISIGLDKSLLPNDRFIFVGDHLIIDEGLELFSQVKGEKLNPPGNQYLFAAINGLIVPDDFAHEQNLIIKEDGNTVLIVGCAHKGIVNILEHFHLKSGFWPSHVIGGFHLYGATSYFEDQDMIAQIGAYLQNTKAKFYTGHCTGIESYHRLKSILGERIDYLSTGSQFILQ